MVAVVLIFTKFVLPQFAELFAQMDELPLSTRILMGFSDLLQEHWILVLIAVILLVVGVRALMLIPKVCMKWHIFGALGGSSFGKLQKTIGTSRLARSLKSPVFRKVSLLYRHWRLPERQSEMIT